MPEKNFTLLMNSSYCKHEVIKAVEAIKIYEQNKYFTHYKTNCFTLNMWTDVFTIGQL